MTTVVEDLVPEIVVEVSDIALKGDPGEQGIQGIAGPAVTLTVGSVTEVAPGSASASITGTSPDLFLNLELPVGITEEDFTTALDSLTALVNGKATPSDIATSIAALSLGSASQHDASYFARPSDVTNAVASEATARTNAISSAIANLVNSAPGLLDTLGEIATRITDDETGVAAILATVTAVQTALTTKAPLASPALTGAPTAPTTATSDNSTKLATTAFVKAVVSALTGDYVAQTRTVNGKPLSADVTLSASDVGAATQANIDTAVTNLLNGAPGALDTLKELADALGDDASFAATMTTALAGKVGKAANLSDVADPGTARANLHVPVLVSCQAVATTNITLSGPQTVDGYAAVAGDQVLATAQTTASQNGPWVVAAGAWTRPTDYASGLVVKGRTIQANGGSTWTGTLWIMRTSTAVTVDATSTSWRLSGPLIALVPPPTGVAATDRANINAAIAIATAAKVPCALQQGNYPVDQALSTIDLNKIPAFAGPGSGVCTITPTAAVTGDTLRVTPATFSVNKCGNLSGFTLDGTSAGAAANGLHYGDLIGGDHSDIVVHDFGGTNIWFDNVTHWTERGRWRNVWSYNGGVNVLFDVNGGLASFGYNEYDFSLNFKSSSVGIKVQNGAQPYKCRFRVTGNVDTGISGVKFLWVTGNSNMIYNNFMVTGECTGTTCVAVQIDSGSLCSWEGMLDLSGFTSDSVAGGFSYHGWINTPSTPSQAQFSSDHRQNLTGNLFTAGRYSTSTGTISVSTSGAEGTNTRYVICTAGTITRTLTTANGRQIVTIRNDAGSGNVTVAASSGTISGSTSLTPGQFATYVCDGTNWKQVG